MSADSATDKIKKVISDATPQQLDTFMQTMYKRRTKKSKCAVYHAKKKIKNRARNKMARVSRSINRHA